MTTDDGFRSAAKRGFRAPASMAREFKLYLRKGNVLELAIAVVMGTAFNAVVTSVVNNIFNPIIGLAGSNNLENLYVPLKGHNGVTYATPKEANDNHIVTLNVGAVFSSIISFVIVSLFCFTVTKILLQNIVHHKQSDPPIDAPCSFCCELVKLDATICPHCLSKNPIHQINPQYESIPNNTSF